MAKAKCVNEFEEGPCQYGPGPGTQPSSDEGYKIRFPNLDALSPADVAYHSLVDSHARIWDRATNLKERMAQVNHQISSGMAIEQQLAMANTSAQQAAMMNQSAMAQQFNAQQSAAMNQVVESAAIQVLKKRIAELEASLNPETGDYMHGMIYRKAMSRIAELEAGCDLRKQAVLVGYDKMNQRANRLSDECGALKTQNTELLAENARLRRGGR